MRSHKVYCSHPGLSAFLTQCCAFHAHSNSGLRLVVLSTLSCDCVPSSVLSTHLICVRSSFCFGGYPHQMLSTLAQLYSPISLQDAFQSHLCFSRSGLDAVPQPVLNLANEQQQFNIFNLFWIRMILLANERAGQQQAAGGLQVADPVGTGPLPLRKASRSRLDSNGSHVDPCEPTLPALKPPQLLPATCLKTSRASLSARKKQVSWNLEVLPASPAHLATSVGACMLCMCWWVRAPFQWVHDGVVCLCVHVCECLLWCVSLCET